MTVAIRSAVSRSFAHAVQDVFTASLLFPAINLQLTRD